MRQELPCRDSTLFTGINGQVVEGKTIDHRPFRCALPNTKNVISWPIDWLSSQCADPWQTWDMQSAINIQLTCQRVDFKMGAVDRRLGSDGQYFQASTRYQPRYSLHASKSRTLDSSS